VIVDDARRRSVLRGRNWLIRNFTRALRGSTSRFPWRRCAGYQLAYVMPRCRSTKRQTLAALGAPAIILR
jgi:hypothetical protein